jgi:hypothetical protein
MARLKLSDYECRKGLMPGICMVCGEKAQIWKTKRFSWCTPLAYLGLLAGLLPFLIIALILTKYMTVRVPLCLQHTGHWSKRTFTILGTFLAVMLFGVIAVALMANQQPANDNVGWACLGTVGLLFVWLVAAAIIQSSAIKASEITESSMTLSKVHPNFVDAIREDRARDREERLARRRHHDIRDDYDDELDEEPRPRRRRRDRDDRD